MPRPRQLPAFSDYLRKRTEGHHSSMTPYGFSCLATLGLSVTASYFLAASVNVFAAFFGFFASLIVCSATFFSIIKWITKPRSETQRRNRDIDDAVKFLNERSKTGSLRKVISPQAAAIFEFAASQWARVQMGLKSSMWSGDQLPLHWLQVRDSIQKSADQSMEDLILMLQPVAAASVGKDEWLIAYDTALEGLNNPARMSAQPMQADYLHAINVAQKMRKLAEEFESVSMKAVESAELRQQLGGRSALDTALDDLRALQAAEAELDQDQLPLQDR